MLSAEKVQSGKQVTVNYTGALLENGKVFDSNTDTAFHHVQPFSVVVGGGQTIRGWEEGLQKLSVGGKGNIYIPSLLGYGPQGMPPTIPKFSSLKFTVEVVKMEDAPAQPQMPMGRGRAANPNDGGAQQDPRQVDPRQQGSDPRQQQSPR